MDMLAAMRVFVRVVERRSLSAAARDLGMGQPAVSERLSRLEAHLNVKLLHRNTRSTSPTDIGNEFYERSKRALEAAEFASGIAEREDAALRGSIRIAAPCGVGELVLPRILHRFQSQHPHVSVDLILNDRIIDPVTEGVDISIRLGDAPVGQCFSEEVGYVRRVLVAAPCYLKRAGRPTSLADLGLHPFLRVTGLFSDELLTLQRAGRPYEAPIRSAWTISNWRPLYRLLIDGAGIGVLQYPAAATALAAGRLKRLLPDYDVPGYRMRILLPRSGALSARTRIVADFLRAEIAALPDMEPLPSDAIPVPN